MAYPNNTDSTSRSYDDQFEHGRIPIKVLPYRERARAQCNELMIAYGDCDENGNPCDYHIYITHHTDPNRYIDITNMIMKEYIPQVKINGDQFTITIDGQDKSWNLKDLLNYIWSRFAHAEDPTGFVYDEDIEKVLDDKAIDVLLQTTDGTVQLPITSADNVFDNEGISIQSRLDNMTRLGFAISYLYANTHNQQEFTFTYPFEDYPDMLEVRIGTVFVDRTRYTITNHEDEDGHYRTGTITFINNGAINDIKVEKNRRIDLIWIFNSAYQKDSKLEFMSGSKIANFSIPTCKLQSVSNSYLLPNSDFIASSKALYDAYMSLMGMITEDGSAYVGIDTSDSSTSINVQINVDVENLNFDEVAENHIFYIIPKTDKICPANDYIDMTVRFDNGSIYVAPLFKLQLLDGSKIEKLKSNKVYKFAYDHDNDQMYLLNVDEVGKTINTERYIYDCEDGLYVIPYSDFVNYNKDTDTLHIYRNGVRLFRDIDYQLNETTKELTLFVRTELGERIVFEALSC